MATAFDDIRPPSADVIADCVHCGFCLPTCPTYGPLWQEEMESPRGRIELMSGLVDDTIPLSATTVQHFDRCLGCMACVTACPSGVRYDRLIEQTRAHVEEHYRRPLGERAQRALVFAAVPHPRRLRLALALTPPWLPGRLRPFAALKPPWRSSQLPPEMTPGMGKRRVRVGRREEQREDRELLELIRARGGCITVRQLMQGSRRYPTADAAEAARRVLAATR